MYLQKIIRALAAPNHSRRMVQAFVWNRRLVSPVVVQCCRLSKGLACRYFGLPFPFPFLFLVLVPAVPLLFIFAPTRIFTWLIPPVPLPTFPFLMRSICPNTKNSVVSTIAARKSQQKQLVGVFCTKRRPSRHLSKFSQQKRCRNQLLTSRATEQIRRKVTINSPFSHITPWE